MTIKVITLAGIRENAIAAMNPSYIPFSDFSSSFILYAIGNGAMVTLYPKLALLVAFLKIASYMNCGKAPAESLDVVFTNVAT